MTKRKESSGNILIKTMNHLPHTDAITDKTTECQFCGGELEESGTCENFLCPDYVAPNANSQPNVQVLTPDEGGL